METVRFGSTRPTALPDDLLFGIRACNILHALPVPPWVPSRTPPAMAIRPGREFPPHLALAGQRAAHVDRIEPTRFRYKEKF